jgi:gas vesicle protein
VRQFSDESYNDNGSSTGAFFTGLFAGAVIGAGLGLWFAPKAGTEMREQLAGTAKDMGQRVSKTVNDLADRGREVFDRAREVVNTASESASQVANEATRAANNVASAARRGPQPTMNTAGAERS